MRVNFRQGILKYGNNNGSQTFLSINANANNTVSLAGQEDNVQILFANSGENIIFTERKDVADAWSGPFIGGTSYWLYWDINYNTGLRTFGATTLAPVFGNTAPVSPAPGQHWFDTVNDQMKEWSIGGSWVRKLRVFACKYVGSTSVSSVSINAPSFSGTQVGDTTGGSAGALVFDRDSRPVKRGTNNFLLTNEQLSTQVPTSGRVRLQGHVIEGIATESIPAYHAVKFDNFDEVSLASGFEDAEKNVGIVEEAYEVGDVVTVVFDGVLQNEWWDWDVPNAFVYVLSNGELSTDPPIVMTQRPIGLVLGRDTIIVRPVRFEFGLETGLSLEDFVTEISTTDAAIDDVLINTSLDPAFSTFVPTSISAMMAKASIQQLSDVDAGPTNDDVLVYNSTSASFEYQQIPGTTLSSLDDTTITAPTNGQLFMYDTTSGTWINSTTLPASPYTFTGNVNVQGTLTVTGATTSVESTNLHIEDNVITLNNGEAGSGVTEGTAGLEIDRGTANSAYLLWDEGSQSFVIDPGTTVTESLITSSSQLSDLTGIELTAPAEDQVLRFDATSGEFVNTSINTVIANVGVSVNELSDVTITAPVSGNILQHDGTDWKNVSFSSLLPTTALNDLTDVTLTSPANGQLLSFNGSEWVNLAPAVQSIDDLNDVTASAPGADTFLFWNGSQWQPAAVTMGIHTDVDFTTPPADGDILVYNGTAAKWEPQVNDPVTGRLVPYDIAGALIGVASPDDILVNFISVRTMTIPSAGPHYANALTAPASTDVVFDIQKNDVSVGSVTYRTNGSDSVTVTADINLVPGDRLAIIAPGTVDSSLENVTVTLLGRIPIAAS